MFTSNIMAVRGLRSLYFALAGAVDRFRHLRNSLGLLLALIGIKFLLKDVLAEGPITVFLALGAVAIIFKRDHRIVVALWEACAQLLLEISSVQRWVSRFSGLRAHANPDGVRLEPL
jgi:predicted tellurium resistance membrane protein TerC